MKPENLIGRVFGHWLVIEAGEYRNYSHHWLCRCTCKIEREVCGNRLRSGKSRSCGRCGRIGIESASFKHGQSGTIMHNIWLNMKDRCNNPNNTAYPRYGGRGIKVCERWQNDFTAFADDMGPRPSPLHSVDRKDNSKGYGPDNCCWSTKTEQVRNRDVTVRDNDGKPLAAIAEEIGVNYYTMHGRYQDGDRGERLSRPKRIRRPDQIVEYRGKKMSINAAVIAAGSVIGRTTARNRIKRGWSIASAVETPVVREIRVQAALERWRKQKSKSDRGMGL